MPRSIAWARWRARARALERMRAEYVRSMALSVIARARVASAREVDRCERGRARLAPGAGSKALLVGFKRETGGESLNFTAR
jgi:hypothetical protein